MMFHLTLENSVLKINGSLTQSLKSLKGTPKSQSKKASNSNSEDETFNLLDTPKNKQNSEETKENKEKIDNAVVLDSIKPFLGNNTEVQEKEDRCGRHKKTKGEGCRITKQGQKMKEKEGKNDFGDDCGLNQIQTQTPPNLVTITSSNKLTTSTNQQNLDQSHSNQLGSNQMFGRNNFYVPLVLNNLISLSNITTQSLPINNWQSNFITAQNSHFLNQPNNIQSVPNIYAFNQQNNIINNLSYIKLGQNNIVKSNIINNSTVNNPNAGVTNDKKSASNLGKNNEKKGFKDKYKNDIILNDIKNGTDKRTMIMIKHIPGKYSLKDLNHIFELDFGIDTQKQNRFYDFIYVPVNKKDNKIHDYAFINFVAPKYIINFYKKYKNKYFPNKKKSCIIKYADIQSKEEIKNKNLTGEPMEFTDTIKPGADD